jgi:hypothetical protein
MCTLRVDPPAVPSEKFDDAHNADGEYYHADDEYDLAGKNLHEFEHTRFTDTAFIGIAR